MRQSVDAVIQPTDPPAPERATGTVRVFISYSRKDLDLLPPFLHHLAPLVDQGLIEYWYDRRLEPGTEWDPEVRRQLEAAHIIVLLISAPFLDSPYIKEVELQRALEKHDAGSARLLPVLLRATYLDGNRLGALQLLPDGKQPVMSFPAPQDAAWLKVVEGLALVAKSLRGAPDSGVQTREPSSQPVTTTSLPRTLLVPSPAGWKAFAGTLAGQLALLNSEHNWSERLFADLAAEVEAEDGPEGGGRRLRRAPSLQSAIEQSQSKIALVEGEPGAGKSVSLRHLAATLLTRANSDPSSHPLLPLYVNLNELTAADPAQARPEEIRDYICTRLSAISSEAKRFVEAHFDWALKEGRWLLLLDSFDEIPAVLSSAQPDRIVRSHAQALHTFARGGMHGSRVVVASRPYRGPGHMHWSRFRILPLGEERRRSIVSGWFSQEEAVRVLDTLVDAPRLGEWVDNPLLLSLICAHRSATGSLPETARDAFESLVSRRILGRGDVLERRGISAEALRLGSERIAFCMTEDTATGLLPSRESLRRILRERAQQPEAETDAVIDCLIELRLGRGSATVAKRDGFGFFHRRLQEFFATCHVLGDRHLPGESSLTPHALLTDERWRETVVTLLQMGAPEQLEPVLAEARRLLEQELGGVSAPSSSPVDPSLVEVTVIQRARWACPPTEFPWPKTSLHLLGILGSVRRGSAVEHPALGETLAAIRSQVDRLLVAALTKGLRLDQAWALESASTASPPVRAALLSWAFESHSGWLEDIGFRQAAHLDALPESVQRGIRRVLLSRHSSGELRREPTRFATQLRRVDPQRKFTNTLQLLTVVAPLDAALLAMIWLPTPILLALTDASLEVVAVGALGALTMALVSHLLCTWYINSLRSLRRGVAMVRDRAAALAAAKDQRSMFSKLAPLRGWVLSEEAHASVMISLLILVRMTPVVFAIDGLPMKNANLPNVSEAAILTASYAVALRPGAYLAVLLGYAVPPLSWPLLALTPLWTASLAMCRRWRATLLVALLLGLYAGSLYLVTSLSIQVEPSTDHLIGIIGGLTLLALYGGGALLLLALIIADWRHGRKLRNRPEAIEMHQLLRDAYAFRFAGKRSAFLRWVREQGKLQATPGGELLLRDALRAIEQDHARSQDLAQRNSGRKLADHSAWSQQFRDWYDEHANPKQGLANWHGETLDELSRLREQLSQRVRDAASA